MTDYTLTQLHNMDFGIVLDLIDNKLDVTITDFEKCSYRDKWFEAVDCWWSDDSIYYEIIKDGFVGWNQRTDIMLYCDLRATFVENMDETWSDLIA